LVVRWLIVGRQPLEKLMTRFDSDSPKLARAKTIAVAAAAVIAAVFLTVAIYGPIQQRRLDNPQGAVIMQIAGLAFVAGAVGFGAFTFWRLGREAATSVEVHPRGLVIHRAGQSRDIPWQDIKQVIKTNNAMFFAMGGLMGMLLFQLGGGKQQGVLLELHDGTRHALPSFLQNAEGLLDLISRHAAATR
jgi:ABC-type nickel/cobalt efflux system permease component RcnA